MTQDPPPSRPPRRPQPQLVREPGRVRGIERGMIFWASVTPMEARGSEQRHDDPSPWVVMSRDSIHQNLPIVQAAPLSTKTDKADNPAFRKYRIFVPEEEVETYVLPAGERGLHGSQLVLTEQARVMSHDRLVGSPVARLSKGALFSVESGLRFVLGI